MNDLEKMLKDVVHGSIGAVATAIEVSGEIAKTFVEKGQEVASGIKQAVNEACEACKDDPGVDVRTLTRAQRDRLRRELDELDAEEASAAEAEAKDSAAPAEAPHAESTEGKPEEEVPVEFPEVTYEAPDSEDEDKA